MNLPDDDALLSRSLELARAALASGDIPVGAVVVDSRGNIIGTGRNTREELNDPTGHAEIVALRAAAASSGNWNLTGCTLYVTLEPCAMCAGALVQARVSRLVFGAWDDKAGACGSQWDLVRDPRSVHRLEVRAGVRQPECESLLQEFFQGLRKS